MILPARIPPHRRNRVLFGGPDTANVYLIYGYHFLCQCGFRPTGVAEAVLIRAIEPTLGQELLRRQRLVTDVRQFDQRPSQILWRQCRLIAAWMESICVTLVRRCSIAEQSRVGAFRKEFGPTITTPRIGITRAAALPLRFFLAGSPYVSHRKARAILDTPRARHRGKRVH